ncbi:aminopeptidase [Coemansia sp. RSA 2706]|nr:aminopeptidase [Coemansia sp. RSA 2706]
MLYVRISILPDISSVVLRGPPSTATSQPLSGRVLFRLGHSLKVKRITVAFQSVSCPKQQFQTSQGQVRMEQVLFDATGLAGGYAPWKANRYGSGSESYEFPFSFIIPGHMHESVSTPYGSVCYELRVSVHTCGFGINRWTEYQKIPIFRVPKEGSPQALRLIDSLRMQADWLGAVELQVLSDTAAVADNSKLRAHIVVRPLQKGLLLTDVGLRLSESVCHKTLIDRFGDPQRSQKVVSERRKAIGDTAAGLNSLPLCQEYSLDLSLPVPKAFGGIQYTMDTPNINVAHDLVLTATVIDRDQNPRYLRISSNVHVVPKLALEDTFAELPAYRSASFDRLLLGSDAEQLEQSSFFPHSPPPSYQCAVSSHRIVLA